MDWLKRLLGIGEDDPYETSQWTTFFKEDDFVAETSCGYKVMYHLACIFDKADHAEFKQARMLDEASQKRLLATVHHNVVLPALQAKGRAVRLLPARPNFPTLCYVAEESGKTFVAADVACIELNNELKLAAFKHSGCVTTSIDVRFKPFPHPNEIIEENYQRMIKLHDIDLIKNTPDYATVEEAYMVMYAHREIELRKQFMHDQTNQTHSGKRVVLETTKVGRALKIAWSIKEGLQHNETLRCYRKEGGFWTGTIPVENNGACITESKGNDATIQNLTAGTDYFFTMVIVETGQQGDQITETIRFSIRMPSVEEVAKVDALIAAASKQSPRVSANTQAALQGLLSFVEFDENVSELEKELVKRIMSKDYTDEEKEEKIARLREVVESLRIQNS